MVAPAHTHAGPEAWYTQAGETCLENSQWQADRACRGSACDRTGRARADAPYGNWNRAAPRSGPHSPQFINARDHTGTRLGPQRFVASLVLVLKESTHLDGSAGVGATKKNFLILATPLSAGIASGGAQARMRVTEPERAAMQRRHRRGEASSPSPEPGWVRLASSRTNRSTAWPRSASGMPGPRSVTLEQHLIAVAAGFDQDILAARRAGFGASGCSAARAGHI